jgi:hypothetical protein
MSITMLTDSIDPQCRNLCSWVVVSVHTAAQGSMSTLKYPSAMCPIHGGEHRFGVS